MITYKEYFNYVSCVFNHNKGTIAYSLVINAIFSYFIFILISSLFGSYSSVIGIIISIALIFLVLGLWLMINIGYAYEITLEYYKGTEENFLSSNAFNQQAQVPLSKKQVVSKTEEVEQEVSSGTSLKFYLEIAATVITIIGGIVGMLDYMKLL